MQVLRGMLENTQDRKKLNTCKEPMLPLEHSRTTMQIDELIAITILLMEWSRFIFTLLQPLTDIFFSFKVENTLTEKGSRNFWNLKLHKINVHIWKPGKELTCLCLAWLLFSSALFSPLFYGHTAWRFSRKASSSSWLPFLKLLSLFCLEERGTLKKPQLKPTR